jgi:cytochrome c553
MITVEEFLEQKLKDFEAGQRKEAYEREQLKRLKEEYEDR